MKLRITQSVEDLNYVFLFSIDPDSISSDDAARICKFGAPLINFGGTFDDGLSDGVTFTLPNQYVALPTGFPVRLVFSTAAPFDTNTAARLAFYRTAISTAVSTAVTTLRTTTDTFTGEYITNI